eukprot:9756192-Karenia_brevis.AAC.1
MDDYVGRAQAAGNEIASLAPHAGGSTTDLWFTILAELFHSPHVQSLLTSLKHECETHGEYKSVSVDGARKP